MTWYLYVGMITAFSQAAVTFFLFALFLRQFLHSTRARKYCNVQYDIISCYFWSCTRGGHEWWQLYPTLNWYCCHPSARSSNTVYTIDPSKLSPQSFAWHPSTILFAHCFRTKPAAKQMKRHLNQTDRTSNCHHHVERAYMEFFKLIETQLLWSVTVAVGAVSCHSSGVCVYCVPGCEVSPMCAFSCRGLTLLVFAVSCTRYVVWRVASHSWMRVVWASETGFRVCCML